MAQVPTTKQIELPTLVRGADVRMLNVFDQPVKLSVLPPGDVAAEPAPQKLAAGM